jgi:hypothetical protein
MLGYISSLSMSGQYWSNASNFFSLKKHFQSMEGCQPSHKKPADTQVILLLIPYNV